MKQARSAAWTQVKKKVKAQLRKRTLRRWKLRLRVANDGAWTRVLIPDVEKWVDRGHGEVDNHLTQILTGHGCFREYLFRIKRTDSPRCIACSCLSDSAEHTLFDCIAWEPDRREFFDGLGRVLDSTNIVECMLESGRIGVSCGRS